MAALDLEGWRCLKLEILKRKQQVGRDSQAAESHYELGLGLVCVDHLLQRLVFLAEILNLELVNRLAGKQRG